MSGIRLLEMEASDMLDVLHFLFEEDFTAVSEEHARSRSEMRVRLYNDLYGMTYSYKLKDRPNRNSAGGNITDVQHMNDAGYSNPLEDVKPLDPKQGQDAFGPRTEPKKKIKFVDASSVPVQEHFSSALDAPLG